MLIDASANQGTVYRDSKNILGYCGWPSVAKDDSGVLYAVFSGNRFSHVCPFGRTHLCKSYDEGKTWSNPIIVNDTPLDDRDAGIICLGGEKMLVSWFVHPAEVYVNQYKDGIIGGARDEAEKLYLEGALKSMEKYIGQKPLSGAFVRVSEDGGNTWGEAVKQPVSAPHGPIRLADGSLFYVGTAMYTDELDGNATAVYKSFDDGKTWEFLSEISEARRGSCGYYEPHAVELPGGRILVAIRVQNHNIYKEPFSVVTTYSDDGGKTWSSLYDTGFEGSPPHFLLHSSGALICVVGRRKEPYGERAYVSYNGGETWEDEYILSVAADGDLGYPASVELSDGSIFTLYYQRHAEDCDSKNRSVLYTKWSLK